MVYCVRRGLVALYTPTKDGSRVLFRIAGPGDLLGYTNFLGEQRSRQVWEAHARDNCEIALITSGAYRAYFADGAARRSAPTLWTNQRRVVPANGQVGQVCRSQFSTPIELVIEELARRFGVSEPRGTLLTAEFNHSDFAEMIASSRPLVSKLIGELIAEGLLIQQGRRYITPFKHH
jgi:CRP-like cAMP-binding protein